MNFEKIVRELWCMFIIYYLVFPLFLQEVHEGLEFSSPTDDDDYTFGIFSVKFSTDGRELVAGSSDASIYVYDLEAKRLSLQIPAHMVL